MPQIIFHVDLDAFFASVEQRDRPELKGVPVIVGADPQGGKGRGVVSTCSYEARVFGIHSAMPISRAYQLCPQAVFLPPDFKKYLLASRLVFRIFYDFTPHIEGISIDEAFLDMSTTLHLFGNAHLAARRLKMRIENEVGLKASVGISSVKMVAKIASDISKPDGLLEVPADETKNFLSRLSIDKLWGVGPKTSAELKTLGISTIGELASLSPNLLSERFGRQGRHLLDLACGRDDRVVQASHEVKSVSHEHTFAVDTDHLQDIVKELLVLCEHVSRRLRKYHLKGCTVTVKIRLQGFKTYTRSLTLPGQTNHADVIFQTARDLLQSFYQAGMKVRLIGVKVHQFENLYTAQSLFEDPEEIRREHVHLVLDKIKDKFGENAIQRAK